MAPGLVGGKDEVVDIRQLRYTPLTSASTAVPLQLTLFLVAFLLLPPSFCCSQMPYIISVEKLRLIAYAWFWGTVVVGVVLTKAFTDIDTDDTLLKSVYGFTNVCVNFDFPPATYVLPALWAITMVFFIAYFLGQTVLISTHAEEGLITARLCKVLKVMKGFEVRCPSPPFSCFLHVANGLWVLRLKQLAHTFNLQPCPFPTR
jgi:hypothetical protein